MPRNPIPTAIATPIAAAAAAAAAFGEGKQLANWRQGRMVYLCFGL